MKTKKNLEQSQIRLSINHIRESARLGPNSAARAADGHRLCFARRMTTEL